MKRLLPLTLILAGVLFAGCGDNDGQEEQLSCRELNDEAKALVQQEDFDPAELDALDERMRDADCEIEFRPVGGSL